MNMYEHIRAAQEELEKGKPIAVGKAIAHALIAIALRAATEDAKGIL